MTIAGFNGDEDLHVMMNMYWESLPFEIPLVEGRRWFRAIATASPAPDDIAETGSEPPQEGEVCQVPARSIIILISK
jgi:glycogen operon protein